MTLAKKTVDTDSRSVTILLGDGSSTTHSLSDLPAEIVTQLALHGLSQKLGDSYSGAANAVAEGEAPDAVTYAKETIARVWATLTAGDWSATRSGGGAISMLARAVAEVLGIEPAEAAAKLEGMEKEAKKKVQSSPKVAVVLARMKAENAARAAARAQAAADEGSSEDVEALLG